MNNNTVSRRSFVQQTAAGLGALTLTGFMNDRHDQAARTLNIVCVGGHPDDPESGCGGTLAKLSKMGHRVTIIYLTRGEAGINGKSHEEAASIRSREAEAACKLLKAKPVFVGQIDGDTVVNNDWLKKLQGLLAQESPDIVFTHWPIDSHKDHQCASLLTIQCRYRAQRRFELYFFEVCYGSQTQLFHPTDYVDIGDTKELKHAAIACHVSQDPPSFYISGCNHGEMESFRGAAIQAKAAEAFVRFEGGGVNGLISALSPQ